MPTRHRLQRASAQLPPCAIKSVTSSVATLAHCCVEAPGSEWCVTCLRIADVCSVITVVTITSVSARAFVCWACTRVSISNVVGYIECLRGVLPLPKASVLLQ